MAAWWRNHHFCKWKFDGLSPTKGSRVWSLHQYNSDITFFTGEWKFAALSPTKVNPGSHNARTHLHQMHIPLCDMAASRSITVWWCKHTSASSAHPTLRFGRVPKYYVFTMQMHVSIKWTSHFMIPALPKVLCFYNQNHRHRKVGKFSIKKYKLYFSIFWKSPTLRWRWVWF